MLEPQEKHLSNIPRVRIVRVINRYSNRDIMPSHGK